MILRYGSYAHAPAECSVVINRNRTYDETGDVKGFQDVWQVTGRLEAADRAALTIKIAALEAAYRVNGQDLGLYDLDGTTLSAHYMDSSATINGVQITDFGYPEGAGAEYSTFRTFRYTAKSEFVEGGGGFSTSYQSRLAFIGTGGAKFVIRPMLSGSPIKQQIFASTPATAIQSGSRTAIGSAPSADTPVYSSDEQLDFRRIETTTSINKGRTTYTTTWNYQFLKTTTF